jgi:hypothetical protein
MGLIGRLGFILFSTVSLSQGDVIFILKGFLLANLSG